MSPPNPERHEHHEGLPNFPADFEKLVSEMRQTAADVRDLMAGRIEIQIRPNWRDRTRGWIIARLGKR